LLDSSVFHQSKSLSSNFQLPKFIIYIWRGRTFTLRTSRSLSSWLTSRFFRMEQNPYAPYEPEEKKYELEEDQQDERKEELDDLRWRISMRM
jgi:hypothetical protein